MKNFFSKELLVNLFLALAIVLLLLLFTIWGLGIYTRHGESLKVPDLKGKSLKEAISIIDKNNLEYQILDSTFRDDLPALAIIDQNPKAFAIIKSGRTIYLTINSSTKPTVEIPDLIGKSSYKYAKMQLEGLGLRVDSPMYKPDPHQGAVLEVLASGKTISKGTKIAKGSLITLVVGDGLTNEQLTVPYLIGLSYQEAEARLISLNLTVGAVVFDEDVKDSLNAIVYKQSPALEDGMNVRVGDEIDLFVARKLPEGIIVKPDLYDKKIDTIQ